jgi:FKBP-type peptidyl-prolyl cis-trans isomerase
MNRLPHRLCVVLGLAALLATPLSAQREKLPIADLEVIEKQWPKAKLTSTGLRYVVLKEGDRNSGSPKPGMMVATLYKGTLLAGKVFDQRMIPQAPLRIRLGRGNLIDGWEEALQKMHKGEQWLLIVPYELGYGTRGRSPDIPRQATLIFDITLIDFAAEFPEAAVAPAATVPDAATEAVVRSWSGVQTTPSGLRYSVLTEGDKAGGSPQPGMMTTTLFRALLPDGTVVAERMDPNDPFKNGLGRGSLIDGWEEALQKMHKGGKWRLLVPPGLAYGTTGLVPGLPPRAPLVFEIELRSFSKE